MREIRPSGSMSGEWKRSMVVYSGTGNRKGRPTRKAHLNHRATPRLYFWVPGIWALGLLAFFGQAPFGRIWVIGRRRVALMSTVMPDNDLWIAAADPTLGATLGSRDQGFRQVPGLPVADWTV